MMGDCQFLQPIPCTQEHHFWNYFLSLNYPCFRYFYWHVISFPILKTKRKNNNNTQKTLYYTSCTNYVPLVLLIFMEELLKRIVCFSCLSPFSLLPFFPEVTLTWCCHQHSNKTAFTFSNSIVNSLSFFLLAFHTNDHSFLKYFLYLAFRVKSTFALDSSPTLQTSFLFCFV